MWSESEIEKILDLEMNAGGVVAAGWQCVEFLITHRKFHSFQESKPHDTLFLNSQ